MIISKEDREDSYLMKAKKDNWEFVQLYSKKIPFDKIESHFQIEADIRYEKFKN